jgi:hypothetical protein
MIWTLPSTGASEISRAQLLDRGWADDEDLPDGRGMAQSGKCLASLTEPHVVGKDGAPAAQQERHPFYLVREQAVCERSSLTEGDVGVVGRREDLSEGRSVCL